MAFKSNDRTFEKIYGAFDKRDYFNAQGLAKVKIGNFERALKKNDKGAQQILDKFNGDMGKAKDYITQVITDRKKEQAFNDYKAFKAAVDSIQKGKPQYGAVDLVKSRIHNSSQKYTIALYSALRNKKFTKWKDVHNDVDSLIGEGFKSDAQRKAAFANGYEEKGKKKNESVNELSDKDIKKAEQIRKSMPGFVGPKFAKKASNEDILAFADLQDKEAEIYNSKIKPIRDAKKKLYKKYRLTLKESVNEAKKFSVKKLRDDYYPYGLYYDNRLVSGLKSNSKKEVENAIKSISKAMGIKESVNEGKAFVVMYKVKKDLPNRNVKPSSAAYSKEADAKKFLKSIEKDGGKGMIVKSNVRGMKEDSEDGVPQGYNPTVENKKEVEQIAKKTKSEKAFYDVLDKIEKKYGKRSFELWLDKSLRDLKINPKKYKTSAEKQEALYQLTK